MAVFLAPPPSACWQYGAFVEGATALRWADAVPVTVLKKLETSRTVAGYTDSFYRVRVGGKERTLWGGELAQTALALSRGTLLVRVVGTGPGKLRQVEAKLSARGKVLRFAPIEVQESDRFGSSLQLHATDGRGLAGVAHVFRLKFTYEACDYPSGEVVLLAHGGQLSYGLRALSSANETGSAVYQLVFPRDKGGKVGLVRLIETLTERNEQGKVLKENTTVKRFHWRQGRMVE